MSTFALLFEKDIDDDDEDDDDDGDDDDDEDPPKFICLFSLFCNKYIYFTGNYTSSKEHFIQNSEPTYFQSGTLF